MAVQEVSRQSETAGALLGWVKAMEAAGEVACGTREQLAQRDACSSAAEAQEAVLAVARPVLAGLEADLQALQVGWLLVPVSCTYSGSQSPAQSRVPAAGVCAQ